MSSDVVMTFERDCLSVPIDLLAPSRLISPATKSQKKYKQILRSIAEVGLVEPLMVHPIPGAQGKFLVIDGHMRLEALKDLNMDRADCLVAKDDEGFTYNKRVNRLSTVQEHFMILRAIENGLPEERIAKALGLNTASIQRKRDLLNGICPEVVGILKDAQVAHEAMGALRRMKPVRQIEAAELMVAAANFSAPYARALLVASKPSQLVEDQTSRPIRGISDEERRKMEREAETLRRDIKAVEEHYGTNMLRLMVANGYLGRLLDNTSIVGYLTRHHPIILEQLAALHDSVEADLGTTPS